MTINQNVVVVSAPVSLTNCPGTTAGFSVTATGTGLTYQWSKDGSELPGQTGSSLSLSGVSAADAGTYSVTVSGVCGSPVSRSATLTVNQNVLVSSAPTTVNQNVLVSSAPTSLTNCPGTTASFGVSATGTGLSYQWYKGSALLSGQTASSLVLPNVTAADAGTYRVTVSGTCGNPVTNSATLTVNQNVLVSSAPISLTSCPGTTASFGVSATGTALTYQWHKGDTLLTGQTARSLLLPAVTAADAGTYRVIPGGARAQRPEERGLAGGARRPCGRARQLKGEPAQSDL